MIAFILLILENPRTKRWWRSCVWGVQRGCENAQQHYSARCIPAFKTSNKTTMSQSHTMVINTKYPSLCLSVPYQAGAWSRVHSPSRWTWRQQARWQARCQGQDGAEVWAGVVVLEAPVIREKIRWDSGVCWGFICAAAMSICCLFFPQCYSHHGALTIKGLLQGNKSEERQNLWVFVVILALAEEYLVSYLISPNFNNLLITDSSHSINKRGDFSDFHLLLRDKKKKTCWCKPFLVHALCRELSSICTLV